MVLQTSVSHLKLAILSLAIYVHQTCKFFKFQNLCFLIYNPHSDRIIILSFMLSGIGNI